MKVSPETGITSHPIYRGIEGQKAPLSRTDASDIKHHDGEKQ